MEYPWHAAGDMMPRDEDIVTVDQKIEAAKVYALLSIGQELNRITTGESRFSEAVVDLARHLEPKAGSTDWR